METAALNARYKNIFDCMMFYTSRFSKKNKKCQKKDEKILSMKEIKKRAEQVSKQSFMQGWIKADPKYGNQLILI